MPLCARCKSKAEIAGEDTSSDQELADTPLGLESGETCDECDLTAGDVI